jgi:hypothetical protein
MCEIESQQAARQGVLKAAGLFRRDRQIDVQSSSGLDERGGAVGRSR